MDYFVVARFIDLTGKILVSYTAIAVHYRVRKKHRIDKDAFSAMRVEQVLGLIGIIFMIVAFVLEVKLSY